MLTENNTEIESRLLPGAAGLADEAKEGQEMAQEVQREEEERRARYCCILAMCITGFIVLLALLIRFVIK